MKALCLKRNALLFALALLVAMCGTAMATEYKWIGPAVAAGSYWNDAANWSPNGIPSKTEDKAIFQSDQNLYIIVSEAVTVGSIVCEPKEKMWFKLDANLTTGALSLPKENTRVRFMGEGALSVTGDGLKVIPGGSNQVWFIYNDPEKTGATNNSYALLLTPDTNKMKHLSVEKAKMSAWALWGSNDYEAFKFTSAEWITLNQEILNTEDKLDYASINEGLNFSRYSEITDEKEVNGHWFNFASAPAAYTDTKHFDNNRHYDFTDSDGNLVAFQQRFKQKGNSVYFYTRVRVFDKDGNVKYEYNSDTPDKKEYPAVDSNKKSGGGGGCAAGIASFALLLVVPMFRFSKKR